MNQISDQLDRHDKMQRLNNRPPLPDDWEPRKEAAGYDMIGVIIFSVGIALGLGMMVQSCAREPMPTVTKAAQVGCLAVAKYAGEITTDKYSRFVMAEIERVP